MLDGVASPVPVIVEGRCRQAIRLLFRQNSLPVTSSYTHVQWSPENMPFCDLYFPNAGLNCEDDADIQK